LPPSRQSLEQAGVTRIILTGSGGPFRTRALEDLADVTPQEACAHPNWSMGRKISVDSATMMNKGLELIEACWLFSAKPEQIQIVVHPQSIVHSMVEYADGSVLAQLGRPDMRTPIAHCLAWPERIQSGVEALDFYKLSSLDFCAPDYQHFPCLRLAMEAIEKGGDCPAALNAANEVAVAGFLAGSLAFTGISQVIEKVMENWRLCEPFTLEDVIRADSLARRKANEVIGSN
jgi:1-deoxy-D-xylulose-5-phosphate reductoisomerase